MLLDAPTRRTAVQLNGANAANGSQGRATAIFYNLPRPALIMMPSSSNSVEEELPDAEPPTDRGLVRAWVFCTSAFAQEKDTHGHESLRADGHRRPDPHP